jgi:hypothetical protein
MHMFKALTTALLLSTAALLASAQPYETANVLSVTPVVTQMPQQVCNTPAGGAPTCTEQMTQVTAYKVEYELNGKRYTAQMNQDPGKSLQVQLSPTVVGAAPPPAAYASPPVTTTYVSPPVYAAPPVYTAPAPIYVTPAWGYPYGYGYGYYPPIGINFGIGYHYHRWR